MTRLDLNRNSTLLADIKSSRAFAHHSLGTNELENELLH